MAIKEEHYFYASNGSVLKSREDLFKFLNSADKKTLQNHINAERNDFANWTRDILKDKKLAKKLLADSSHEGMVNAVRDSLKIKKPKRQTKKSIISQLVNAISNG